MFPATGRTTTDPPRLRAGVLEVRRTGPRLSPRDRRRLWTGLAFVSPWIVGVVVFVVYPVVYSFVVSLTRYSG